jgi:hypothetical protein
MTAAATTCITCTVRTFEETVVALAAAAVAVVAARVAAAATLTIVAGEAFFERIESTGC